MREAIITMPDFGTCEIDVDKVAALFDDECFISRWHDTFRLCRADKFKASISFEDAHRVIGRLGLRESQSPLFRNGRTYRMREESTGE